MFALSTTANMNEAKYILDAEQLSTEELHDGLRRYAKALVEGEDYFLSNAANICSLVYHSLPALNWVGFYLVEGSTLHLGPFQGKPACTRITVGSGVCGSCVVRREAIVVDDVLQFEGHISCDPQSRSELVLPLMHNGSVQAIFDLDSPIPARFGPSEVQLCEKLIELIVTHSRF